MQAMVTLYISYRAVAEAAAGKKGADDAFCASTGSGIASSAARRLEAARPKTRIVNGTVEFAPLHSRGLQLPFPRDATRGGGTHMTDTHAFRPLRIRGGQSMPSLLDGHPHWELGDRCGWLAPFWEFHDASYARWAHVNFAAEGYTKWFACLDPLLVAALPEQMSFW